MLDDNEEDQEKLLGIWRELENQMQIFWNVVDEQLRVCRIVRAAIDNIQD
jgi:hypothetical protein